MLNRTVVLIGILMFQSLGLCCFADDDKPEGIFSKLANKFGKVISVEGEMRFVDSKLGVPEHYSISIHSCEGKKFPAPIVMNLVPWSDRIAKQVGFEKLAKESGKSFRLIGFEDVFSDGQPPEIFKVAPGESIQTIEFCFIHRFTFFKLEELAPGNSDSKEVHGLQQQ